MVFGTIEVVDLKTKNRRILLDTGGSDSLPRAIAVDPITK